MSSKPRTFVVTIRTDIRDMATICLMLKDNDILVRSQSELASQGLGLLADLARAKGFDSFTSTASALNYLQTEGIMGDPSKSRNYKALITQLQEEDKAAEIATTPVITSQQQQQETSDGVETLEQQVARRLREANQSKETFQNAPEGLIAEEED